MSSQYYKAPWYRMISGSKTSSVFGMTDPKEHAEHRRLTANNFSEKWLSKLEPYVAKNVELAVARMREDAVRQGYFDVFKWFTFMASLLLCVRPSIALSLTSR